MKKTVTIILILIAIPLYVWDGYLIYRVWAPTSTVHLRELTDDQKNIDYLTVHAARSVSFTEQGRSPFLAYKPRPKPKVVPRKKVQPKPKVVKKVLPPRIVITGIMWNPTSPMAMVTLPDGSSTVARAGMRLNGEIEVKTIERTRMEIMYKKKTFWITK